MTSRTVLAVSLLAATSSHAYAQFRLTPPAIAGISCDRMEGQRLHIH